ncbi:hypothetical protein KEM56_003823 [Ascosphaera pollenicola]|nr:hypothetical protein KEM56_003823 [Ascosphaera pollenicola]
MNIFRITADLAHLVSIFILLQKMKSSSSCSGLSFKSQALYFIVYVTRYLDLFWTFTASAYNTIFKLLFIASSAYTIYLMVSEYKPTHDPNIDTFKVQYLLGGSLVIAVLFPYEYTISELFMLQRTGEADTITTHYLFALGIYRALYIPNWIYRYITTGHFDPIAVTAGIIQTVLYSDFFWIYYTKVMKGQKFKLPV